MIKDKVILILGGTGDIGSAIAKSLAQKGASVCSHGFKGEYAADVRDEGELSRLITKIISQFNRLDVVINSLVTPIKIASLDKKTWQDFLDQFSVQLKAGVDLLKYVVPQMQKQQGGQIINILSSVVAGEPPQSYADYITLKYALLGFSKCLARELKAYNILVNCVSPDFVKTKLTQIFPEKVAEIIAFKNPTKRLTTPEDVARVVSDLILDTSKNTGRNIFIRGGEVFEPQVI